MANKKGVFDLKKLPSAKLTEADLLSVVDAEVDANTLVGHHMDSFNNFVSTGINQIITQLFTIEKTIQNERVKTAEDQEIALINFVVKFTDARLPRPTVMSYSSGKKNILMPNLARLHNLNYSSPVMVDANITAKAFPKDGGEPRVRVEEVKNFQIASMPVMVGSKLCHTSELSLESKKNVEEDPKDPGGYFILKGGEWVISMIETRLFNNPHIFRNVGHEKEIARLEFISKPGDAYENSSELIMRYVTNGNIFLTFTSNNYLKLLNIPFFVLFRLMGMTTDKEIIDNIVYGYSSPEKKDVVSDHMLQVLKKSFRTTDPVFGAANNITDQGKLLEYFSRQTTMIHQSKVLTQPNQPIDENLIKYLNANILKLLDKHVFPHIGLASDTRHKKLRYLGHLIHKMLLVEMQISSSTDRDSLKNKRINAAGRAYAKALKTQFNLATVQPIKKKLTKDFKSMPFSQVPLAQSFKSAVNGPDLEKALIQAIVTGNKELTVKNRQIPNRLASEMLHRKNQLNFLSTMRVIRTPSTSASKQDQRADEIRRVHSSYTGFICPLQSADTGDQVGMVKQMALGASLTEYSSSELLKEALLSDEQIIPLDRVFPEQIHEYSLTKIHVNGDWIGCCLDSPTVIRNYKEMRRGYRDGKYTGEPGIDPKTTIYWDTDSNEILFWTDAGRMVRPLLIIRNNGEFDTIGQEIIGTKHDPFKVSEPGKQGGFVQDILLTKQDVDKLLQKGISVKTLHERGIIDYIAPEEMENCYIAPSLDELHKHQTNPLQQYTHCEIPPALLGIAALTCPYTTHNQAPRITFQTNQSKQTCGWYCLNWPYRIDKHMFLQYYCETPLIKTIVNQYLYPNGLNAVVGIACYGGYNQEDSLIFNKGAAERGLYKGRQFNVLKKDLEKGEHFGNPDETHTLDIKKHANYEHLVNGFVKRGTKVLKDDVIIGSYMEIAKPSDSRIYKDTSVVFPYTESAVIENIVVARNQDDEEFAKVKFSSMRTLGIGDKFSSRSGQKGVTGMGYQHVDMLFTLQGIVPDLVLNPHAIPSRMTIGQLVECLNGKVAALRGAFSDATAFTKLDIRSIGDELETLGFDRYGVEPMCNGMTGEWIDVEVFIGPTYYQRLQKFVVDEVYSISTGPTCVITRRMACLSESVMTR
jgi:DNA-directed RNA polymerase beta subunit